MPNSLDHSTTPAREREPQARGRALPALTALLLLAGCTGAKLDHVAQAPVHAPTPPATLFVDVALTPEVGSDAGAYKVAMALQADLVKRYRKAGLLAYPAADTPRLPGAAILHVRISRADPGNRVERLIVGFGAGRSTLRTDASLDVTGEASPALSFSSSANSGRKPGLIMPGAIAAATGNLSHLAIGGGLDLLLTGRSGLMREADRTASAIVRQTQHLYNDAGWTWPRRASASA